MDEQVILHGVEEICRTTFKNARIQLKPTTTAADVNGWDSLSHVLLIRNVEKHFKIKITVREALRLENVGRLVSLIQGKVG